MVKLWISIKISSYSNTYSYGGHKFKNKYLTVKCWLTPDNLYIIAYIVRLLNKAVKLVLFYFER